MQLFSCIVWHMRLPPIRTQAASLASHGRMCFGLMFLHPGFGCRRSLGALFVDRHDSVTAR
jgi:hypothetical protein